MRTGNGGGGAAPGSADADLTMAARLVVAALGGEDLDPMLDECDTRAAAELLARTLAGMIGAHGGDPAAFMGMLTADRVHRAAAGSVN